MKSEAESLPAIIMVVGLAGSGSALTKLLRVASSSINLFNSSIVASWVPKKGNVRTPLTASFSPKKVKIVSCSGRFVIETSAAWPTSAV